MDPKPQIQPMDSITLTDNKPISKSFKLNLPFEIFKKPTNIIIKKNNQTKIYPEISSVAPNSWF